MTWQIPLSDLDFGPEEAAAVQRVLQSKWLSMGPETKTFEEEFAAFIGVKHAIAVSNGTAALHLAFLALGIGSGDEIIQPAVNFVASANMTNAVGARPVFADICSLDEPAISPESISSLLSSVSTLRSAPRPKAVVVMHYGGYLCRMAEIRSLCQEHGLALIEDACHAIGARYDKGLRDHGTTRPRDHGTIAPRITHHESRPSVSPLSSGPVVSGLDLPVAAGALGDIGCFSFFSNKNLATGEGGMLTTNRDDIADKARNLRSHGMSTLTWDRHRGHAATYDVLAHGYNYRLDDLRSALGREQLKKLERNNQRRRELTAHYWRKLEPLEARGWTLPFRRSHASRITHHASRFMTSAHLLAVVAPDAETRWRCAEALKAAGIQTSLHYPLVLGFTAFRETASAPELPQSGNFCQRVITLPLYPTMTEVQVETVCGRLADSAKANV
jgi:dTDP-4-amino-4,6-dideoxygalactose transaminase